MGRRHTGGRAEVQTIELLTFPRCDTEAGMRNVLRAVLIVVTFIGCREPISPADGGEVGREVSEEECPLTHPDCNLRSLTPSESTEVHFISNHVRWDSQCQSMKWDLQTRLFGGRIRVWDGTQNGIWGDFHPPPQTLGGEIHLWQPLAGGIYELPWTVLHEDAHSALGIGGGYSNENTADFWANYCWLGD